MNIIEAHNREEFRHWLELSAGKAKECYVVVKRGKPKNDGSLYYLDAVEEALCFGWIDSIQKNVDDIIVQRFSPRGKRSPWTELNKERARRLIRLGLMTERGKKALPPLGPRSFKIDPDVVAALKKARVYSKFKAFPELYQRVRAYNVSFYKRIDKEQYQIALARLIQYTKKGEVYGEWNDYGRLLKD